jgi:hypothetical protein
LRAAVDEAATARDAARAARPSPAMYSSMFIDRDHRFEKPRLYPMHRDDVLSSTAK